MNDFWWLEKRPPANKAKLNRMVKIAFIIAQKEIM